MSNKRHIYDCLLLYVREKALVDIILQKASIFHVIKHTEIDNMGVTTFSHCGRFIAYVWRNIVIKIVESINPANHLHVLFIREYITETESTVNCMAFNKSGKYLVSADLSSTIKIWDLTSGTIFKTIPNAHTERIFSIDFSHCDRKIVTGSSNSIKVWDLDLDECLTLGFTYRRIECVRFSPVDNNTFVSGDADFVRIWKLSDTVATSTKFGESVTFAIFSPCGDFLAYNCGCDIVIRSVRDLDTICTLVGHTDIIYDICFNSKLLVSASRDGTVKVWDIRSALWAKRRNKNGQLIQNIDTMTIPDRINLFPEIKIHLNRDGELLTIASNNIYNVTSRGPLPPTENEGIFFANYVLGGSSTITTLKKDIFELPSES